MRGITLRRGLLVGLLAVCAALGIATAVRASIPDSQGTIDACYYTPGKLSGTTIRPGTLRVIDTEKGQECASDETPLSWDQLSGLDNQTQVKAFSPVPGSFPPGTVLTATAHCPAGTHLISGGGEAADVFQFVGPSYSTDITLVASKGDPTADTWTATGVTTAPFAQLHNPLVTAYADCT